MEIQGYAVRTKGGDLSLESFDAGNIGPDDIALKITHCGVCHSDIDLIDDAFGQNGFPMVPGHEIIGLVDDVGANVSRVKRGDRVGIGPIHSSCGQCRECQAARDHYCPTKKVTASPGGLGGFANRIVLPARSVALIPDALSSAEAAPLLCAGVTTFSALRRLAKPGENIAVLGVGGLGHLAVQFARHMGMRVTTLSVNLTDDEIARHKGLGATECVDIGEPSALKSKTGAFDMIVSTIYGDVNWMQYLSMLRPEGRLCILGASLAPLAIPAGLLIPGARAITGSAAGSSRDMRDMLAFAAEFGVSPQIETLPMQNINDAIARVRSGKVRYRMVLEA